MSWDPDPVILAYALAVLILISSISSIWSLVTGSWRIAKNPNHDEVPYEDLDGVATLQSTKEFSNKTQFTVIYFVVVIGLALSVADFVFLTANKHPKRFDSPSDDDGDSNALGVIILVPAWVDIHFSNLATADADKT